LIPFCARLKAESADSALIRFEAAEDGLKATRRILQLPNGQHVPILALNANACAEGQATLPGAGVIRGGLCMQ
jgi:CheY-like chemotaxis protein